MKKYSDIELQIMGVVSALPEDHQHLIREYQKDIEDLMNEDEFSQIAAVLAIFSFARKQGIDLEGK